MKTTKIGCIGKPALAIAFALLAGGASAALTDVRTWTGDVGDNRWNNTDNWEGQKGGVSS